MIRSRAAAGLAIAVWLAGPARAEEPPPPVTGSPLGPEPAPPPAPPPPPPPAVTEEMWRQAMDRMAKQEQQLGELRDRLAADRADRAREEAARAAAPPTVGGNRVGLTASGFVQMDYTPWRQSSVDEINFSTGDPINEERFLLKRARLRLAGDYGILAGAVEFDGNTVKGATARIIGAEVSLRWPPTARQPLPLAMLTIGSFKIPFGFEVGQADTQRLFLERSTSERAFFPGEYDLGLRLAGGWRFLRYALAMMNGEPIGEKAFPMRDPNGSKDFVGRVGVETAVYGPVAVAAGVSGLVGTGFHKGTPSTKDVLVWRDLNENGIVDPGELQVISGSSETPSQNFDRFAFGADLRVAVRLPRLGELVVYGELVYATNLDRGVQPADPVAASRDLRELGWYVAATQEVTRFAQVGVRYDSYNPDAD